MEKVKVIYLDRLMVMIAKKTKQSFNTKGFQAMREAIGENKISETYLYQKIYIGIKNAKRNGKKTINLNRGLLDHLADFLGYHTYPEFVEHMDNPVNPILLSCIGNYYSYVRQNDDKGIILRSPVKIYVKEGKVCFDLKGGKWTYAGDVEITHGCLFILMRSSGGKMIHHVYKIGARDQPHVLQGIFSGVSTAFDPIGGRAVLVRLEEKDSEKLFNKKLEVTKLTESKDVGLKNIGHYLADRNGNNLSINSIGMTFGIDDLRTHKIKEKQSTKKKTAKRTSARTKQGDSSLGKQNTGLGKTHSHKKV
jgi:hypothetical protein